MKGVEEQANPEYEKFDPIVYYDQYYKSAEGTYAHATYPLFPKLIRNMKGFPNKVPTVLDLGTGPILYGSIVMRNHTDSLFLSDYNNSNREALKKWVEKEDLPYDFNYITNIVKEIENSSNSVEDMQDITRSKIKAILDVNVFDDKVIQGVHWKRPHTIAPGKFDILAGFTKFPEYAVGEVVYKELSHTLDDIIATLKACGMGTVKDEDIAISQIHYKPDQTTKDMNYHELHGEYVLISRKL